MSDPAHASIPEPQIATTLEADYDKSGELEHEDGDEEPSSLRTSLSSNVGHFRTENGRTYHTFKDGSYPLPNDESEKSRLDLQHHLFRMTLDGKLHLAPIGDNVRSALDVGTGTGIWAIDFADEHPSAKVTGCDLSPIQPTFVAPNLDFIIDDAEQTWAYPHKFDFIHARMLTASLESFPNFIKQSYDNLYPGGWMEIQDKGFPLRSDDNTLPETSALYKCSVNMIEGARNMRRPLDVSHRFTEWMVEAGFVDVVEVLYKWPLNPWPKGEKEKESGAWTLTNWQDGIQGFTMRLFTRGLGWTPQEVEDALIDIRKDLANRDIHAYMPIHVVYGRKPAE